MKNANAIGFGALTVAIMLATSAHGQWAGNETQSNRVDFPNALAALSSVERQEATLSTSEKQGLLYMREEEKLALDVYVVLEKKWGSRPFGNISRSEQRHVNSVKVLLEKYGIDDPVATLKPGQFKDKNLQKLYNDLIKSGGASRIEALKVGATIEDVDLYDLARWAKLTDKQDILSMYEVLADGSRNHMRAFVRNLSNSGVTYKPRYISQETFDEIINVGA